MFGDDELEELNTTTWAVPLGWTADNVGRCRSCGATVMCGGGSVRVGGLRWSICRPCGRFTLYCSCPRPAVIA